MDIDWTQVTKALIGKATNYLGGGAGQDYARNAEDLAQDTLVILLEKELASTEEAIKLGTEILRRDATDLKRVESRRRELEQENGDEINRNCGANWSGDDPSYVLEMEQELERIEKLSPVLRQTLERVVKGLTYAEIAAQDMTTEQVIRKRVQRAKEQLGA